MQTPHVLQAWWRVLSGYRPFLSIEITNRCPLACPGCYAFQPAHRAGGGTREPAELTGAGLVRGVLQLVDAERPLVVYLVGGEPLVRFRELGELLPALCRRVLAVHVVTSAVRQIPQEWASLDRLSLDVSIDGLAPEHDARRRPATYARILENIAGQRINVHCTLTRQLTGREGYLDEFFRFWGERAEVRSIQVSLFTPQLGEESQEILAPSMRRQTLAELRRLLGRHPKLRLNERMLDAFDSPPRDPRRCLFARLTRTRASDLETEITPCQIGGRPDCAQCGCLAAMGLQVIAEYRPLPGVKVRPIFAASDALGRGVRRLRGG